MARGDVKTYRSRDALDMLIGTKGGHKTYIDNGWNKPSTVGYGKTRQESRDNAFKEKKRKKRWWE